MAALVKSAALLKVLRRNWKQMLRQQHSHTSMSGKSASYQFVHRAANGLCGWLLHSKTFLIRFVHLSEAVMCPACLRGFDRWP